LHLLEWVSSLPLFGLFSSFQIGALFLTFSVGLAFCDREDEPIFVKRFFQTVGFVLVWESFGGSVAANIVSTLESALLWFF
jgi:hypothetical protein